MVSALCCGGAAEPTGDTRGAALVRFAVTSPHWSASGTVSCCRSDITIIFGQLMSFFFVCVTYRGVIERDGREWKGRMGTEVNGMDVRDGREWKGMEGLEEIEGNGRDG